MLELLLYIGIGMFIGWNFPQPTYAKLLQAKFLAMFKKDEK